MFFRRLLFVFTLVTLAGCRPASAPTPEAKGATPATIQDDLGRPITLKGEVKRLVVIGPGAIETIYALGAGALLVGRDSYADFPVEAKKIAVAGDYTGPSVEKCVALRPDLIIVQGETWDKGRVENWQQQIGAPVAALTATSLRDVQNDFLKIGAWVRRAPQAIQLAKSLEKGRSIPKVSAFVEIGRSPLYTAGTGTLVSDVMQAGGFSNVAADVRGYQPFGIESLLARQPAVYIAPSELKGTALLSQLRSTPALSKLKCVQAGRVIGIKSDFLLRPGPRLQLGIEQLKREAVRFAIATAPKK